MPVKTTTATKKTAAARSTGKPSERRTVAKAAAKDAKPAPASVSKADEDTAKAEAAKPEGAKPEGAKPEGAKSASRARKDQATPPVGQASTDLDLDHFRSLLLAERARMEVEREQIRNRSLDVDGALPDEGDSGDEDTADLASAMMDKEMDLSVEDEIEDVLAAIDHALQKMEEGTYGICDISGQPIPRSRLELIPWASLTVECQALSEGE